MNSKLRPFFLPENYTLVFGYATSVTYKGECDIFSYEDTNTLTETTYNHKKHEHLNDYDTKAVVHTDKTERLQRVVPLKPEDVTVEVEGDVSFQNRKSLFKPNSINLFTLKGNRWVTFSTEKFLNDLGSGKFTSIKRYTHGVSKASVSLPKVHRTVSKQIFPTDDRVPKETKLETPGTRICILIGPDGKIVSWWKTTVSFYYFLSTLISNQRQENRINYTNFDGSYKLGVRTLNDYMNNKAQLEENSIIKKDMYIKACIKHFLQEMETFLNEYHLYDEEFMTTLRAQCRDIDSISTLNELTKKYKINNLVLDDFKSKNMPSNWSDMTDLENTTTFKGALDFLSYSLDDFFSSNYHGTPIQYQVCKISFHAKDTIPTDPFMYTRTLVKLGYIPPVYKYLGITIM